MFDVIHQVFMLMAVMKEMIVRTVFGLDTKQKKSVKQLLAPNLKEVRSRFPA